MLFHGFETYIADYRIPTATYVYTNKKQSYTTLAPVVVQEVAPPPPPPVQHLSLKERVYYFGFNSTKILNPHIPPVSKIKEVIAGTDWIGNPRYNLILSQKRALEVKRYLEMHGIRVEKAVGTGGKYCHIDIRMKRYYYRLPYRKKLELIRRLKPCRIAVIKAH